MDEVFWNKFYIAEGGRKTASNFAYFCSNIINKKTPLFEMGCGNGADAIFFADKGITTFACDQFLPSGVFFNPFFIKADFTDLPIFNMSFGTIYSRFSIHSVNLKGEQSALDWAFHHLEMDGLLCVEARSIKDGLYGKGEEAEYNAFITDHYRRFVDKEEFVHTLSKRGFETVYIKEGRGLAPYNNEDPICVRIIAKKLRYSN